MKIGQLDKLITLNKEITVTDKYGTPIGKKKEVIGKAWAHISNLHGDEYYVAHSLQLHKEVLFTIRYNRNMDEKTIITFENHDYIVSFVDNIKYKNRFMEIRAVLKA